LEDLSAGAGLHQPANTMWGLIPIVIPGTLARTAGSKLMRSISNDFAVPDPREVKK
jgi:hypothetical protein